MRQNGTSHRAAAGHFQVAFPDYTPGNLAQPKGQSDSSFSSASSKRRSRKTPGGMQNGFTAVPDWGENNHGKKAVKANRAKSGRDLDALHFCFQVSQIFHFG